MFNVKTMFLEIYSLKDTLFNGAAKQMTCRSSSGEITVLDHHRPLLSMLLSGVVKIVDEKDEEKFIEIGGGFIEVKKGNRVRLIVESVNH
jgi:F-type H+-transporting ATPase subunit epsilon